MNSEICRKIIERECGNCLICGRRGGEVAHCVPRSRFSTREKKRDQPFNLALLCRSCHSKTEQRWARVALLKLVQSRYGYLLPEEEPFSEYTAFFREIKEPLKFLKELVSGNAS